MASLVKYAWWLLLASVCVHAGGQQTLFSQSAQAVLNRQWSAAADPRISWMLFDARSGQNLAQQWPIEETKIPVGSLLKPVIAIAYARTHHGFPQLTCYGNSGVTKAGITVDRCWLPRGHGRIGITDAIAHSCNAYFLALARETDSEALRSVAIAYGLPPPPEQATPATLIGLDDRWRIDLNDLARAYLHLLSEPESAPILTGLRQAARSGTAAALREQDALAKTGTASCLDHCIARSDGLVLVMTPSAAPRLLLLVRQRGATGAATASVAAHMLAAIATAPHSGAQ